MSKRRVSSRSSKRPARSASVPSKGARRSAASPAITVKSHRRIKIISMGDQRTGKSCLIKRFCENKFVSRYIPTIGVDFGVKPIRVNGAAVRVNFWDLSGHNEFFEVRNEFYKDSQGAILVFDVGSRRSFENLDKWLQEAQRFGATNLVGVVVGNKVDDRDSREVRNAEGISWAASNGFRFFDTSAQSGRHVKESFMALFEDVLNNTGSNR